MRGLTLLAFLCWAVAPLAACGARSPLYDNFDVVDPDRPDVVVRDARPDVGPRPDTRGRVLVTCPAPVHTTQTATHTLTATARSTLGRPLAHRWELERAPVDSRAALAPADQPATTLTCDVGGEWLLRFTATDDMGNSDTCTVPVYARPAIDLVCPQDRSGYQGETLPLVATARSNLGREITVAWTVDAAPAGSTASPVPAAALSSQMLLDALGDWTLRLTATDTAGLTSACRVNLHADPDVIVGCPPDQVSRPFAELALAATASSRRGLPLTYRWEIVERPVTSTSALNVTTTLATGLTLDVAGGWTFRFEATNPEGNRAFCTTRARAVSDEAVRVELVWNLDRSCRRCNEQGGGIDLDLHLAEVDLAQGRWGSAAGGGDCFYQNCKCGRPGMLCETELLDWPPAGRPNNPQLDIDHISDVPGPENINVRQAAVGARFDVGVHYYSCNVCGIDGPEATPAVVRVYCDGAIVFESERVQMTAGSAQNGNNLWRVGRVTRTPAGCTFERCGAPGALEGCIRPQGDI